MVRRFVTLDGEIQAEVEWPLKPIDKCFYCDEPLILTKDYCYDSFDGAHEFVTLVNATP